MSWRDVIRVRTPHHRQRRGVNRKSDQKKAARGVDEVARPRTAETRKGMESTKGWWRSYTHAHTHTHTHIAGQILATVKVGLGFHMLVAELLRSH